VDLSLKLKNFLCKGGVEEEELRGLVVFSLWVGWISYGRKFGRESRVVVLEFVYSVL
jgi:hypothetical protein